DRQRDARERAGGSARRKARIEGGGGRSRHLGRRQVEARQRAVEGGHAGEEMLGDRGGGERVTGDHRGKPADGERLQPAHRSSSATPVSIARRRARSTTSSRMARPRTKSATSFPDARAGNSTGAIAFRAGLAPVSFIDLHFLDD